MEERLAVIASRFALDGEILDITPVGEGFINDTYRIRTGSGTPDYILQRKNGNIFKDVPAMMENIRKVTDHIRRKVLAAGGDPDREVLRVIPTRSGTIPLAPRRGGRALGRNALHRRHGHLRPRRLARAGPQGRHRHRALPVAAGRLRRAAGRDHSRLPQHPPPLRAVGPLARDAAGRCRSAAEEIGWIESRREEMLAFWRLVEEGVIPRHVTHNDTKISNILFDRAGNVLCVIDLDTVMNSTSLNDFGDAIRTYTNTGAEDDRDLRRVGMSMELFTAYTEGYLSQHARELSPSEREYLAFSARYITYEQVLRFLMDYLDGDTYYKTRSADHNLVRTRAQYRLLQSMEEQYDAMCDVVRRLADRYATTKH